VYSTVPAQKAATRPVDPTVYYDASQGVYWQDDGRGGAVIVSYAAPAFSGQAFAGGGCASGSCGSGIGLFGRRR